MRAAPRTTITLADLRARRAEIIALAARYGASNVRVFGSVARGVALEDLLGCRVDVATVEELKPRIRQRVLREAVPLTANG